MNLHRLVFVVAMSLCLVTSAATAAEAREHGTPTNEDKEITDIQTDEELRLYLNEVRQLIPPSDCSEWNQDDARVVAVFEFRTNKELWIGKEYDDSDGLGVNGLQRTYEIEDISKGGSPIRGSIKIRLPTTEMDTERVCFTTLQGIHVRGAKNDGEGVYRSDLWNMTIDEVNFGILVEPQGIMKEKTPTGETQVTLTISEGLVTMVLRKSVEHLWALPGSFVLMALSGHGKPHSREKACNTVRAVLDPTAKFSVNGTMDGESCRPNFGDNTDVVAIAARHRFQGDTITTQKSDARIIKQWRPTRRLLAVAT